jgi:hypothetical protein
MSLYQYIRTLLRKDSYAQKSTTVRYAFPLVFAFAALLTATSLVSQDQSFVHLESNVSSVRAGETFEIQVFVTAHVPVNAVDLSLSFPKDQITITGIDKGESVITLWTQEPAVENNTVILRGGTFRKGFVGDHLIATVNAKAKDTGLAQFSVDSVTLLAGDGTGSKVRVAKTGSQEKSFYIVDAEGKEMDQDPIKVASAVSVFIVTDIDGDGSVSLGDISRFMVAWQNKSVTYDFNGDGVMSFRDFGIILADSFLR